MGKYNPKLKNARLQRQIRREVHMRKRSEYLPCRVEQEFRVLQRFFGCEPRNIEPRLRQAHSQRTWSDCRITDYER